LFEVNGSGSNVSTPFRRIVDDVTNNAAVGPWYLPYDDEIMDPDFDLNNTPGDGPQTQAVTDDPEAGYSWSITVARPYDPDGAEPDYVLGELWRNEHAFIVQVAVYRNYAVEQVDGTLDVDRSGSDPDPAWTTMIVESVPASVERTFKSGDYVRYLNFANSTPGDGFWYQVDQIGGDKVKLLEKYWEGLVTPVHFFPKSSWEYAHMVLERNKSEEEALVKARTTWAGSDYHRGECEDAYYQLCFGKTDPLDSEFQQTGIDAFKPLFNSQKDIR